MDSDEQVRHAVAAQEGWATDDGIQLERQGIDHVPPEARYGKPWKMFTVWFAPQLNPVTFFLGALGPAFGLSFWQSVFAILLALVISGLPVAWLTTWGPKTGLSQMVLTRSPFGRSTRVIAILNWITTVGWQAFDNVFGAAALNILFDVPFWMGILIILVGQTTISFLGYEAVHFFQRCMTYVLGAVFLFLTFKVLTGAGTTAVDATVTGPDAVGAFILMVAAIMGNTFTWTSFAADYSRYLPENSDSRRVFASTFFGLVLSSAWIELLGLAVAFQILDGGLGGTVTTIRDIMGGGLLGVIGVIAAYLGIVSINALDDYTGSLSLQAAGVKLLRPVTALISATVAFVASLIFIYAGEDLPNKAQNFLLFIAYWVSAWLGIVVVDYFQKRGRFDPALLTDESRLPSGRPALIAFVVGTLAAIPFSNTTFGYDFITAHPDSWLRHLVGDITINSLHGADIGLVVGFSVAALVFALLSRVDQPRRPEMRRDHDPLTPTR
jgi:nucleobase:cation symporter-1, NCS1 family